MTAAAPYTCFKGPSAFSIFDTMAAMLQERGGDWAWREDKTDLGKCALILGDRFDIPYEMLRGIQTPAGHPKPLVNYFKGSHRLTLKASMAKLLRDIPEIAERMPESFVVGGTNPAAQKKPNRFAVAAGAAPKAPTDEMPLLRAAMAARPDAAWIVKPSAGCKGKGIIVTRSISEVEALVAESNATDGNGVFAVQRYIDNPMLIGGRKFDIRVWALLAPPFEVYVFNQGSCRTASAPFSTTNLADPLIHLTNHDLQEHAPDYGKFEPGNELWYSALAAHVAAQFPGKSFDADVMPQILQLIARCLCAAKDLIEVGSHEAFRCFQLFGFDLLLDDNLTVHLIEINGSPGSAERWLEPMVGGLIDLVVDPSFPPASEEAKAAKAAQQARVAAAAAKDGEAAGWTLAWASGQPLPFATVVPDAAKEADGSCVLVSRNVNRGPATQPA